MKITQRLALTVIAASTVAATGCLVAPAASAAPVDSFTRAYDRLVRDARDGLTVITSATPSDDASLGILTTSTVPGGSTAIVRTAFDGAGNGSQSVTLRGGTLRGSRGVNPTNATFSTFSMMPSGLTPQAIAGRGLTPATAITNVDGRLLWSPLAPVNLKAALGTLLPPDSDTADRTWKKVRVNAGPGGSTVVTATAKAADGSCTYPSIKVIIKKNRIASTDWTSVCRGVRTRYVSTVSREARIEGAKAPRLTEAAVFATPSASQSPLWATISAASNKTAVTPMARIEKRDANGAVQGTISSTILALDHLDAVMAYGNPGTVQATGTATEGGKTLTTYKITPIAPDSSLAPSRGRQSIQELTVVIDNSGVIRSITSKSTTRALATPLISTNVFTPSA